ncbi:methylenetetrahydrofolate reductase [NAD(P)H] [Spirochaetota bacterium]
MSKLLTSINARKNRISIELVPPGRGRDPDGTIACVEAVARFEPAFVSVTDHPAGRAWEERMGKAVALPIRAKPGTLGLCVAIREKTGALVVPHLVCIGNGIFKAEDQLIDLCYAGFNDIFIIRGDERFIPFAGKQENEDKKELKHALDLVELAAAMNRGEYLSDGSKGAMTKFSVGVAAYPEKHPQAANLESDLAALANKEKGGASWAATQMLFDAAIYESFVNKSGKAGIGLAIIPGVKPVLNARSLSRLPGTFFVNIPQKLVNALENARSPAEERLAGIKHAASLVQKLYDAGAPCVHFFTMGRAKDTVDVLEAVFGPKGAA